MSAVTGGEAAVVMRAAIGEKAPRPAEAFRGVTGIDAWKKQQLQDFSSHLQNQRAKEALTNLAKGFNRPNYEKTLEQHVIPPDPADKLKRTKDPASVEGKAFDAALEKTKLYSEFLQKGFDRLGAPEKKQLCDLAKEYILSNPVLTQIYEDPRAPGTIPDYTAQAFMRDPRLNSKLAEILQAAYDPDPNKMPQQLELDIQSKKRQHEQLGKDLPKLEADAQTAERNLKKWEDDLNQFQTDKVPSPALGGMLVTRQEIVDQLPSLSVDVQEYQKLVKEKEELEEKKAANGGKFADAADRSRYDLLTNPTGLIVDAKKKPDVQEYSKYANELQTLESGKADATTKHQEASDKLKDKQSELDQLGLDIQNKEIERQNRAVEYADNIANALKTAAQEVMDQRSQEALAEYDRFIQDKLDAKVAADAEAKRVAEEAAEQAKQAADQAAEDAKKQKEEQDKAAQEQRKTHLQNAIEERWKKTVYSKSFWTRRNLSPHIKFNVPQIQTDKNILLLNGPDALMSEIMVDAFGMSAVGNDNIRKLEADKDYIDAMKKKVAARVLATSSSAGIRFTRTDVESMALSPTMAPMVSEWINNNKEVQGLLKKAEEQGLIQGRGAAELMRHFGSHRTLLLIMAGLGIAGAVALGPAFGGVLSGIGAAGAAGGLYETTRRGV